MLIGGDIDTDGIISWENELSRLVGGYANNTLHFYPDKDSVSGLVGAAGDGLDLRVAAEPPG